MGDKGKSADPKAVPDKMQFDSSAQPTTLIIRRKEKSEEYDFWIEAPGIATTCYSHLITLEFRANINKEFQDLIDRISCLSADSDYTCFMKFGKVMFKSFLPEPIQQHIKKLKTPLLIATDDPTLPWEMLHDGKNFMCLRIPIGRKLMTTISINERRQISRNTFSFLMMINHSGDLKGTESEAKKINAFLDEHQTQFARRKIVSGASINFVSAMWLLQEGFDVIHYSGHTMFDEQTQSSYLELDGGQKIQPNDIINNITGYPIVFFNSCQSAVMGNTEQCIYTGYRHVHNLAQSFIIGNSRGGALAFIGTLWKVSDAVAAQFSIAFYAALFGGKTIGESLLLAKQEISAATKDLSWAAFVLYGDPSLRIIQPQQDSTVDANKQAASQAPMPSPTPENGEIQIDSFGDSGRLALYYAYQEMLNMKLGILITAHLFIALTKIEEGYTSKFLLSQGFEPKTVRDALRRLLTMGMDAVSEPQHPDTKAGISERFLKILYLAGKYAMLDQVSCIEEKHLLQGFLEDGDGITVNVLQELGITMPEHEPNSIISMALFTPGNKEDVPEEENKKDPSDVNLDEFTTPARRAIQKAAEAARLTRYPEIRTPHLLIGLTEIDGGVTAGLLSSLNVSPELVRDSLFESLGTNWGLSEEPRKMGVRCSLIIKAAQKEAWREVQQRADKNSERSLKNTARIDYIEERHLLWALLKDGAVDVKSFTMSALKQFGLEPARMLELMPELTVPGVGLKKDNKQVIAEPFDKKKATPTLSALGRELTVLAKDGKLSPVIGRDTEMELIVQILSKKTKSNPLLIGPSGVGKTAIVEGLAQRISEGMVPPGYAQVRLIEITPSSLLAGTKYRGEFEARLQTIIKESREAGNVILFIDEIHTLIGAGESTEGSMDAANILKPALARAEIRCIGATTIDEYRKHIERDAALERRFQTIMINEPNRDDTLTLLRSIKEHYEKHHGVSISDEALKTAVELSIHYITDRHLPDKAISLLDLACARHRTKKASREKEDINGRSTVRPEDVEETLSQWKGIPVGELRQEERDHLFNLESRIKERIIGQDQAITAVCNAIGLSRAGLNKQGRPVGVFLFLGPTGVGKTAMAKALADALFGSEEKLIRLDMSEFSEQHSISKLIGSPPGYKGYGDEGHLTGKLKTYPYSIVLLDEIDKAHRDVFDIFIQLFGEGRLTDGKGHTVDAKNAIFIMTSNLAADVITAESQRVIGFSAGNKAESQNQEIQNILKCTFSPEFLGRIDEVVVFNQLTEDHVKTIARIILTDLQTRVMSRGITLQIDESAVDLMCREGYTRLYGVRPMERLITEQIAKPIGWLLLKGPINEDSKTVLVTAEQGKVTVKN